MERRTDQKAYFPIEMQFYISVMFLSFPDEILKEKPSFLDFENNWLRTDRPTDHQTYLPVEKQFYISVMFLGLPDVIYEEKPSS